MEPKARKITAEDKIITDLPNEVIGKCIMVYLSDNDLLSLVSIVIERIKQIAQDVLEKRRE